MEFLSFSGLIQEDRNDYIDFSNFVLLEKTDERYLEVFPPVYISTVKNIETGIYKRFETGLDRFLSEFIKNPRNRNILKHYFGLGAGKKQTLKEISLKYRISIERAEKIIKSILRGLSFKRESQQIQQLTLDLSIRLKDRIYYEAFSLASALLAIVFMEYGKVLNENIFKTKTNATSNSLLLKILFIFRILNIPFYKIAGINTYIFGAEKKTCREIDRLIIKKDSKNFREIIDPDSLKKYISGIKKLFISSNEVDTLAGTINDYFKEISQTREIVYAAFKKLGRPAHYSEVTKICNTMFKERVFTSNQIHACLASKNQPLWVWIGLRGVYALKEWGFKRPDKGLYQTVFEIINSKYGQTFKPVPLNHIYKEIGKHRRIVNENSLYFACNFNPKVKVLKKDLFIPVFKGTDALPESASHGTDNKKPSWGKGQELSRKEKDFLNNLDKQFRKTGNF